MEFGAYWVDRIQIYVLAETYLTRGSTGVLEV